MDFPKQLSIKNAAKYFDIPEWTLRTYIRDRVIPYRRLGRKIYIPIAKFEEWLERGDVEPDTQKTKLQAKVKKRINNKKIKD